MNVLQRTWSELVPNVPEDGFAGTKIDMPGSVGVAVVLRSLFFDGECFAASSVSSTEPPYHRCKTKRVGRSRRGSLEQLRRRSELD
jgi:hypothetical protein